MSETNAIEQASLLTGLSLSPVAVADVSIVSLATANSAVLAMAKVVVKSTYKIEIKTSELYDSGNTRYWKGKFVVTNYSDEDDAAESDEISVELNDDLETVTKQKIEKILNKENTDDLSITGLFKKEYDDFCAELKRYALNPLTSFYDACQACIDILIEQGVGNNDTWSDADSGSESNLYENLYAPYYDKLMAIEAEMRVREDEIKIVSGAYDTDGNLVVDGLQTNIEKNRIQIQSALNFEDYLGEELWLEFCAYRREDKFSNDNYISDGLNNAELFKRALEFFEVAENEIYKSAELQHSISTTLNNLLAIPKFKKLVKSFRVGNWIRTQVDNRIYKLRLLEYDIDFGDFDNIPVEFSDVTKIKNGTTDVRDILSQASSMATSYGSIQRQASQGDKAKNTLEQWVSDGLNSALVQIQNNDNEDITLTKYGLLCRSYDDITGTYSPEQLKLTHNIMAYTDDEWKTVRQAIGKHEYILYDKEKGEFANKIGYGMNADFVTAGVVSGSQIIGGDIYSDNYSKSGGTGSYLNLRDGTFSFGGGSLRFEGGELLISSPNVITKNEVTEINERYLKTTTVYAENLQVGSANIVGELTASQINTTGLIAENISGTTITGKSIMGGYLLIGDKSGTYAEIASNGVLSCSGANITGVITANDGEIGGWTITGHKIYAGDGKDVKVAAMQAPTTSANWVFAAGGTTHDSYADCPFRVHKDGSVYASNLTVTGGTINIGSSFKVSNTGVLTCSGATVNGVLTAGVGSSIGGWSVDGNSIYAGSWTNSANRVFMCTGTSASYTIGGSTQSGWVFGAGSTFGVTKSGGLYSTSGKIGDWTITNNGLSSGDSYIASDGRFLFRPANSGDNWCGFLKIDSNTYNFAIGSNSRLQLGSTLLTESDLKKLLTLI
jgi:hypothetical protein